MADRLWPAVAQSALGVMLGEVAPRAALSEVLGSMERSLGVACAVEDVTGRTIAESRLREGSADRKPRTSVSFELRDASGSPAGRLLMFGVVDATVGERLARVLEHLVEPAGPSRASARSGASMAPHALRNTIAVALANIELVESMLGGATPESPLLVSASSAERAVLLRGLTHAADAMRAVAASLAPALPPRS
jgi:hypothetical protein